VTDILIKGQPTDLWSELVPLSVGPVSGHLVGSDEV
jgi:hypothetical protein